MSRFTTCSAPPARAEEWKYDLAVYMLGAGIDGTVGIGRLDADVDVGFSDILDNLEFGAMSAFRATKDRWAVTTDLIYVGLGASTDRVDVDVDQLILQVDLAYRFSETFEVLFGVRYLDLDNKIASGHTLREVLDIIARDGEAGPELLILDYAQMGDPAAVLRQVGGFLGGRFGAVRPLALSASLVFEQSYGGVDGDSASSAELYALLSVLAGLVFMILPVFTNLERPTTGEGVLYLTTGLVVLSGLPFALAKDVLLGSGEDLG